MLIGCPKEIKNHEYRVGLVPENVNELVAHGHRVIMEKDAGLEIGATDEIFQAAGAEIRSSAKEIFAESEIVIKVKEPLAPERAMLRPDQILFTYLHLAPDVDQTRDLMQSKAVCIAYETVTGLPGELPLLKPMSQVAGRMAPQAGAMALQKAHGGCGVLMGGIPGVHPAKVVIIGGGVVGRNAALMAQALGADVTILDRDPRVLEQLDVQFQGRVKTLYSQKKTLNDIIKTADLVIGAVLIPGAAAPKLITRDMLSTMQKGAVLVDVAIDQGGCFETSKPTTHSDPIYIIDGIVHYCVANMPGAVARTSAYALNNVTLPHIVKIANQGWQQALKNDPHLANGLNVCAGHITCQPVAEIQGRDYCPATTFLEN